MQRSGFTLMELVFAMAIVAATLTMAVPVGLRMQDDYRAGNAARWNCLCSEWAAGRFRADFGPPSLAGGAGAG